MFIYIVMSVYTYIHKPFSKVVATGQTSCTPSSCCQTSSHHQRIASCIKNQWDSPTQNALEPKHKYHIISYFVFCILLGFSFTSVLKDMTRVIQEALKWIQGGSIHILDWGQREGTKASTIDGKKVCQTMLAIFWKSMDWGAQLDSRNLWIEEPRFI